MTNNNAAAASGTTALLKALTDATRSLETIQLLAGKEDTLEDMMQVRAYATSRAMVANAAIAAFKDASAQTADECQHGSKHIVHDCMRCGAPVCCGKCCAEDAHGQAAKAMSDAYIGAREDLAIWKKRALEAEELNRKFAASVNGQVFMGEPAAPAQAGEYPELPSAIDSYYDDIDKEVVTTYYASQMRAYADATCAARGAAQVQAMLAAAPSGPTREPLEFAAIYKLIESVGGDMYDRASACSVIDFVRTIEAAHGIAAQQGTANGS